MVFIDGIAHTKLKICFWMLLGWILFTSACSTDPVVVDPSAFEKLYVFGVLSPATKHQEVYLSITQFQGNPRPVKDARVRISGPAGEVSLSYVGDGIYRDQASQLQVMPGSSYRLCATLTDGREISATTTIPSNFKVVSPLPGDTVKAQKWNIYWARYQLPIIWEDSANGWVTLVKIYYEGFPDFFDGGFLTAADSLVIHQGLYLPNDIIIKAGILYFTHCDTAFSIYTMLRQSAYNEDPSSEVIAQIRSLYANDRINVNGASGVFGSVVTDSVRFYIRVSDDQRSSRSRGIVGQNGMLSYSHFQ
ncbi:MAG: DUF4249 domain-containing protein [candidate division KSB1 bacterium]|nr:DUF4249 domain-containing protein [candidate division KSB1 bacterium]